MLAVRKTLGILVSLVALAGVLVTGVLVSRRIDQRPRTDDAYLQADVVHMAPDVSGRIVELDVRDNQKVQKGQVLFRIDPEPYQLRVDQARAAVRGLEATLAVTADQVASQTSKADAAASGINAAEAQTCARLKHAGAATAVARARLCDRPAGRSGAHRPAHRARLRCSRRGCRPPRRARRSRAPSRSRPSWKARARTLALAERDLNKTVVRAPCDGRITALEIAAGEFADDRPAPLHDHRHRAVVCDRQFPRDRPRAESMPGQHATVYVMAQPSLPLRGEVESLGWGVASDVSATFGGPAACREQLNWVRIAARFPVRILLDAPPDDLMRLGASAVVVIEK